MKHLFVQGEGGLFQPGRRRFVLGAGIGGLAAAAGLWPTLTWSQGATGNGNVLSGTEFDLTIGETPVDVTGVRRMATLVNGSLPAPVLKWKEGTTVTLRATNRLPTTTSVHWHGILPPANMDGVPGLSFEGIKPGETFVYRFDVAQSGTYWYHSHSRFQEQTGLYGAIVVEPRGGERHRTDRDYVVLLSDWSDEDPETIFSNLKKMSDYYNFNEPTAVDFMRDVAQMGMQQALARRQMWNTMRMSPTDFADVTGKAYTYLVNGASPMVNWTGLFAKGEKVRLRFINGSSQSIFDVRIPGLKLTVVSADSQDVEPVTVDEFRIATAETYDVIVQPTDDRAYTIFAQSIDRLGFTRATLAPQAGMQAAVPEVDKPQWLSMTDMMGAMGMGGMGGMDHGGAKAGTSGGAMQGMDHGAMQGMDHGLMQGMNHGAMGDMGTKPDAPPPPMARHARSEYGPATDMRVDMPRINMDDPGIGLRDNGRRVLTYADLHTIGGPLDKRGPSREIELHLNGNMQRYIWSFDGQKFSEARPLHFRYGERLRIVLVNDTMMPHPIHLHGMWSEMEGPKQEFLARKHTIMVQPAQRISYLVNADALGRWAYHCHMLYHMEAGMFREVVVS